MEITNGNWREILLTRRQTVKYGDNVVFRVNGRNLVYKVCYTHLSKTTGDNDTIFIELDLDPTETCRTAYGYCPFTDNWPEYRDGDFDAATNIIAYLYGSIEAAEIKSHIVKLSQDVSELKKENPKRKTVAEQVHELCTSVTINIKPTQSFKIIL